MRPRMEGNQMFTIFGPKRHKGASKQPADTRSQETGDRSQEGGGKSQEPRAGR
jgi:hypothetical protein